jgi:hypothetical protein
MPEKSQKEYRLYQLNIFAECPAPSKSAEPTKIVAADFLSADEAIAAYSTYWEYLKELRSQRKDEANILLGTLADLVTDIEQFTPVQLSPYSHHSAAIICDGELLKQFSTDLALEV